MKKHKTIKEIEERRRKKDLELKNALMYLELKKGITKNKEDYEEEKSKRYVKNINEANEFFNNGKRIEITEGTKKEGRHTYPTKSQMEWNRDKKTKYIIVKKEKTSKKTGNKYETEYVYKLNIETTHPELLAIKNREKEKIYIPPKKERVILFLDNFMFIRKIKIYPTENSFLTEIKMNIKNWKKKQYVEKFTPEKETIYETIYGKITGEELTKIILGTKLRIYKINYTDGEVIMK